jgi:hypothetical protein
LSDRVLTNFKLFLDIFHKSEEVTDGVAVS